MIGYIYGLIDPRTNLIVYIGLTFQKVSYRLNGHIHEARCEFPKDGHTRKIRWLKKLLSLNLLPILVILEQHDNITKEDLENREIYLIKEYKEKGYDLVNGTDGGKSIPEGIKKYQRRTEDKKVYSFNEFTKEIIEYKNIKEAGKAVCVKKDNIPKAIHIKGRCKGLFWSYNKNFQIRENKQFTKIAVFNDSFYKEYNSIWEAMDNLNIPRTCKSRIGYRLNDGLSYYGMYFKRLSPKSKAGPKQKEAHLKLDELRENLEVDNPDLN